MAGPCCRVVSAAAAPHGGRSLSTRWLSHWNWIVDPGSKLPYKWFLDRCYPTTRSWIENTFQLDPGSKLWTFQLDPGSKVPCKWILDRSYTLQTDPGSKLYTFQLDPGWKLLYNWILDRSYRVRYNWTLDPSCSSTGSWIEATLQAKVRGYMAFDVDAG